MNRLLKKRFHSLLLALLLHGVLLSLFLVSLERLNIDTLPPSSPVVRAYVSPAAKPSLQSPLNEASKPLAKALTPGPLLITPKRPQPKLAPSARDDSTLPESLSRPNNTQPPDALISLLHARIQQYQHYPEEALALEQQGVVQVSFTLFPHGGIGELSISHSSGIPRLDSAALAAVRAASPFPKVDAYLQAPSQCHIQLRFSLSE